jgi:hypothetical protein
LRENNAYNNVQLSRRLSFGSKSNMEPIRWKTSHSYIWEGSNWQHIRWNTSCGYNWEGAKWQHIGEMTSCKLYLEGNKLTILRVCFHVFCSPTINLVKWQKGFYVHLSISQLIWKNSHLAVTGVES